MEKRAFLELLLNLVSKYGLKPVSKFLSQGVGPLKQGWKPLMNPAETGSVRKGLGNALGGLGESAENAASYLTKRPVLSDTILGAGFAAMPSQDPDSSFASRAMTEIPATIGFGALQRGVAAKVGPWWEKMKQNKLAPKPAGIPSKTVSLGEYAKTGAADPTTASKILDWLQKRTVLENALVGTGVGAGVGTVTDQGPLEGLMRGSTIGAGIGTGSMAGAALGNKIVEKFPALSSKLLTGPAAGVAGAVAGGVLAHKLYNILAGQKKYAADKQALANILREHLERQRHPA